MTRRAKRTGPKATVDIQRLARALASPGIDSRSWFEVCTVGVLDENGEFSTVAPVDAPRSSLAVAVQREGAIVSVRIESTGEVIFVRYNGISCGRFGSMLLPVRPGDEVLVAFPSGSTRHASSSIIAILSNATAPIPADWANERVLFVMNVPFEVRAPTITLSAAGGITLNGRPVGPGPEGI